MHQTTLDQFFNVEPQTISYNINELIVFTDGSTIGNGSAEAKGGYATIWPFHMEHNIGLPLFPSTNNRAEYSAVIHAIKTADIIDPLKQKTLIIYTDSMLIVNSITKWLPNWKKNNYMKSDGKPVLNQDLIKFISESMEQRKLIFRHVRAHTNLKGPLYLYNDLADQFAKKATLTGSSINSI